MKQVINSQCIIEYQESRGDSTNKQQVQILLNKCCRSIALFRKYPLMQETTAKFRITNSVYGHNQFTLLQKLKAKHEILQHSEIT